MLLMSNDSIVTLAIIAIFGVILGVKLFLYPGKLGRKLVIFFLSVLGMYIAIRAVPPVNRQSVLGRAKQKIPGK